jgi:predicted O-methyltransferase YrrM
LFIDGDHAYETVRRELALLDLLRPGAALLHDTFYQPGSTYNHGPWLAIQDYLKDQPAFQVVALQTGLPGMTYIAPTDPHA